MDRLGSRHQVLAELRRRQGEYVSGEELSRKLGLSRTAIWKHIQALRREGYRISASTRRGYALLNIPDCFYPEEVMAGLRTSWLGRPFYYYDEVGSTNQVAKDLADAGAPEGTVVVAETQKSGRGRLGRSWFSPGGKGIWVSTILRPRVPPVQLPQVSLLAAVAATEALEETTGLRPGIKWPNDLLLRGRKLAGILTEMRAEMDTTQYVVVGIGINVNLEPGDFTPDIQSLATSLEVELGRRIERLPLLQALLYHLEGWYERWQEEGFAPVAQAWRRASVTLGRQVRVVTPDKVYAGRAVDIDEEGALLVKDEAGRLRRFNYGEISLR
ncbi:biotin--[acetyl-CoA-carboxylase] ligase [Thermanaeromonas sp. C210]|uniref:biotin--[acetyl-CoA-carboxylase] ligase n=1 Tax=Thermanaeromonas sp. C210 TaxID=2731925 RepID=UPI00155CE61E|nr:biotin--[acetyl-CoA-carboxylase] ligase [Thermanaeromonas sp. C210]GFN22865.1 bifunctional ligase/repressor BirA [Thermanaeromonas sp. C210]